MDMGAWTRIGKSYMQEFAENSLAIMKNFASSLMTMFEELTENLGKMLKNLFSEVVVKAAYGVAGSVGSWAASFFSKDIAKSIQYGAMLKSGETKIDLSKIMEGVRIPAFEGFDKESLLKGTVARSAERATDIADLQKLEKRNSALGLLSGRSAAAMKIGAPLIAAGRQLERFTHALRTAPRVCTNR